MAVSGSWVSCVAVSACGGMIGCMCLKDGCGETYLVKRIASPHFTLLRFWVSSVAVSGCWGMIGLMCLKGDWGELVQPFLIKRIVSHFTLLGFLVSSVAVSGYGGICA